MEHPALIVASLGTLLRQHPPLAVLFCWLMGGLSVYAGYQGLTTGKLEWNGSQYGGSPAKLVSVIYLAFGAMLAVLGFQQALIVLGART